MNLKRTVIKPNSKMAEKQTVLMSLDLDIPIQRQDNGPAEARMSRRVGHQD